MPSHRDPATMEHPLTFTLNGKSVTRRVEPRRTLLELLREDLGDTSPKEVCGAGNCGACTVLLDGRPVYSCLLLAVECDGKEVRTASGLSRGGRLHPVQQAFLDHDGYQCGYCTPGQVISAVALLERNSRPGRKDVIEALGGNLCRCGAYDNIIRAVLSAAATAAEGGQE